MLEIVDEQSHSPLSTSPSIWNSKGSGDGGVGDNAVIGNFLLLHGSSRSCSRDGRRLQSSKGRLCNHRWCTKNLPRLEYKARATETYLGNGFPPQTREFPSVSYSPPSTAKFVVFIPNKSLEFINLSRFWNLVIFVRERRFPLANPVDHAVMVDTRHPLNASKSHAIERHLNAEVFHIRTLRAEATGFPEIGAYTLGKCSFVCLGDVRFWLLCY